MVSLVCVMAAEEIFEQAYLFAQELRKEGKRLSNVVMMGMGEPLANYKRVIKACELMNTELGIGARHITISTVGLAPRIRALAREPHQFTLAVSLHAAQNNTRYASSGEYLWRLECAGGQVRSDAH